ncbi:hypothetical protein MPNT_380018 [Candidatus Methylacidithermus pantelleriae]|uniref:Uncharacterized protein n=1 Tax=Candidatus Methylacidithermus pantelleriae TaxID=2744239 RepID=A0A8J2FSS6_9BACT|nr:hypothetical protein MPNT_380018 [Candidatus Methylacidithermus pantelleriae]
MTWKENDENKLATYIETPGGPFVLLRFKVWAVGVCDWTRFKGGFVRASLYDRPPKSCIPKT